MQHTSNPSAASWQPSVEDEVGVLTPYWILVDDELLLRFDHGPIPNGSHHGASTSRRHLPPEYEERATTERLGVADDPGGLFGLTIVRWYPNVQWFDRASFAIAERIRTRMGDRAPRRNPSVLPCRQRAECHATRSGFKHVTVGDPTSARAAQVLDGEAALEPAVAAIVMRRERGTAV